MLNIGQTIKFDYTSVTGAKTMGRQIVIEQVKPYMHTRLIVGKSFDENGQEKFRTFHEDKMANIELM